MRAATRAGCGGGEPTDGVGNPCELAEGQPRLAMSQQECSTPPCQLSRLNGIAVPGGHVGISQTRRNWHVGSQTFLRTGPSSACCQADTIKSAWAGSNQPASKPTHRDQAVLNRISMAVQQAAQLLPHSLHHVVLHDGQNRALHVEKRTLDMTSWCAGMWPGQGRPKLGLSARSCQLCPGG